MLYLNEVFAHMVTDPNYQTKMVNQMLLKLKEEAIAKVLAEIIIKKAEGTYRESENY